MRKFGLTLLACSLATLPVAAFSQEAASPDEFVCAFTNDCPDQAAAEEPDATGPQRNANGGRIGEADRSFSLSTSGNTNTTRRPTPRPRATTSQTVRNTARAPRVVATQPGRVNLSLSFGVGSATLTSAAQAQIRSFAQALQRPQLATMRVAIEGHTDSSGSRASNLSLSQRRAQSVATYLVSQGVARNRVEVRGYGFDRPLPGRRASDPSNRRVEAVRIS